MSSSCSGHSLLLYRPLPVAPGLWYLGPSGRAAPYGGVGYIMQSIQRQEECEQKNKGIKKQVKQWITLDWNRKEPPLFVVCLSIYLPSWIFCPTLLTSIFFPIISAMIRGSEILSCLQCFCTCFSTSPWKVSKCKWPSRCSTVAQEIPQGLCELRCGATLVMGAAPRGPCIGPSCKMVHWRGALWPHQQGQPAS